jgi:energy-coupling factor transport system ATP-binding protein
MPVLSLSNVRFKHKGSSDWSLDIGNLEIGQGEFVTVLGPNGSGKTTLSMLPNGLVPKAIPGAFEGAVRVFGHDASHETIATLSTLVGLVFQEPESQLFCMSVEEEVAFGPENLGVPQREIADRVEWALGLVGLSGMNDRSPFTLSGGQKQRLAIAAALSMKPRMLVLDEPAYALDPVGRIELYSMLNDLKREHGMTVLLMERDPEDLIEFSDRFVLMSHGKVVAAASPSDLARDVDRLRSLGIPPPQLSELAAILNARVKGHEFSFLTMNEAVEELTPWFNAWSKGGKR